MTKLTAQQLIDTAITAGCDLQELKTYYKLSFGENRKAIYIAKSKRALTRVDFSGFELDACDVIETLTKEQAKEEHLGAVRARIVTRKLRPEVNDEDVLAAFEYGLSVLMNEEEGFKLGKKKAEEVSEEESVEEEVDLSGLGELQMFAADEEDEESDEE